MAVNEGAVYSLTIVPLLMAKATSTEFILFEGGGVTGFLVGAVWVACVGGLVGPSGTLFYRGTEEGTEEEREGGRDGGREGGRKGGREGRRKGGRRGGNRRLVV